MTEKKKKKFIKHINKKVRDFKKDIITLALNNNYPYISSLLERAIYVMEQDILEGRCDAHPAEYGLTRLK